MKCKRKELVKYVAACLTLFLLAGCGGSKSDKSLAEKSSGDMESYEKGDVNAIQQALPQIMVIPGDICLKNFGALSTEKENGRNYIIRDYKKYLNADNRAKRILSTIQEAFVKKNYPLTDFEQTLKQLDTDDATDNADNLAVDAKTQLLTVAQPDIILELNYDSSRDHFSMTSHNYTHNGLKNISYTLNAIDACTDKVIASISSSNIKGESTTQTLQQNISKNIPELMEDIQNYFSDILKRGREITVRVAVEDGSNIKLSDSSAEGDAYSDWIVDYMKSQTVKGAYKMARNTDTQMYFVNCRIKVLNENGTQYGVYDWARDFCKNLRKNLGLKVTNKAQGLGEVLITIKGM